MRASEIGLALARLLPLAPSKSLEASISRAGMAIPARAYLSVSFFSSLLLSLYFFAILLSLSFPPLDSLAWSLLIFALLLYIFLRYPNSVAKRRAQAIESDLPLALRSAAMQVQLKLDFEKILSELAEAGYGCSPLLSVALREIKSGKSIPQSLSHAQTLCDSVYFKRSCASLSFCYEHGGGSDQLMSLAGEIASVQQSQGREFSSKLAILGLIFIASSALLPSFFLVFALTSSAFLSSQISTAHIWLAFLLAFPALDAMLLLLSLQRSPIFLKTRKAHFLSDIKSSFALLLPKFSLGQFPASLQITFGHFAIAVAFLSLSLAFVFFLANQVILAILALSLPALALSALIYLSELRASELDASIPDAMFRASALGKSASFEKMLSQISEADSGPLSEEFSGVLRQIRSGANPIDALNSLSLRTNSLLLSRCARLLVIAYRGGSDTYWAVRATAEDMLSLFSLIRERASALSLQKYTLLAASAILIPLILGSVTLAVSGFAKDFATLGISQGKSQAGLFQAAHDSAFAYLLIFSAISAVFIANQEGQIRRAPIYFFTTAPLGAAVFLVSSSVNLFGFL